MVPLELELNHNNNDLGEDSAVSYWETGGGVHTGSVQKRYYDRTLTSTNGLGLLHCYPGMHEACRLIVAEGLSTNRTWKLGNPEIRNRKSIH